VACGYPKGVKTVLGLLGVLAFIVCVIGLAAGITYLVVKISPSTDKPKQEP
jgi:hypothetical protein